MSVHPQTPADVAAQIVRYLTQYRRVIEQGGPIRSMQFTVKFGRGAEPRHSFWSVEREIRPMQREPR